MAITQGSSYWYKPAIKNLMNGVIDLDSHTFKMALLGSGYTFSTAHEFYDTHITNELATAGGYTQGGQVLTNVTWTSQLADRWKFSCDSPTWSVTAAGVVSRSYVVYDDTPAANKPLLLFGYHDYNNGAPRDITPASGSTFTVIINTDGLFLAKLVNSN